MQRFRSHAGRHEYKMMISYAEYALLSSRLGAVLDRDSHSKNGGYDIRSVYFDDFGETSYYLKLDGVLDRKKYRLRVYNLSEKYIVLERKEKHDQSVNKYAAVIAKGDCDKILDGDFSPLAMRDEEVCRSMFIESRINGMRNSVITDYRREAFVYPVSNLRITFDTHLHAGIARDGFDIFDDKLPTMRVYPFDSVILEIKYDDCMPDFVTRLFPRHMGSFASISKYCECKRVFKSITDPDIFRTGKRAELLVSG